MAMNEVSPTKMIEHDCFTIKWGLYTINNWDVIGLPRNQTWQWSIALHHVRWGNHLHMVFLWGAFQWLAGSLQGICSVAVSNNQISDRKILIAIWKGYKCIKAHYVCRNACGKMLTCFYVSMVLCTCVQMEICLKKLIIYIYMYT